MTSPEILGKLGTKPNRFERAPTGGASITGIDVAHAMGCVVLRNLPTGSPEHLVDIEQARAGSRNSFQSLLLRVKYAGDASAIAPLVAALTARAQDRARQQEWLMRKTDTCERMVVLALRELEYIRPRRVLSTVDGPYECGAEKCRGCRGVGRRWSTRQNKNIDCERCEIVLVRGAVISRRRWSDRERGDCCGISHTEFTARWERRLDDVKDRIKVYEGRAMRRLRQALAEDDEDPACLPANSGL